MKPRSGWHVPVSNTARNTINPIRRIIDTIELNPHPEKQMIALSIGKWRYRLVCSHRWRKAVVIDDAVCAGDGK